MRNREDANPQPSLTTHHDLLSQTGPRSPLEIFLNLLKKTPIQILYSTTCTTDGMQVVQKTKAKLPAFSVQWTMIQSVTELSTCTVESKHGASSMPLQTQSKAIWYSMSRFALFIPRSWSRIYLASRLTSRCATFSVTFLDLDSSCSPVLASPCFKLRFLERNAWCFARAEFRNEFMNPNVNPSRTCGIENITISQKS